MKFTGLKLKSYLEFTPYRRFQTMEAEVQAEETGTMIIVPVSFSLMRVYSDQLEFRENVFNKEVQKAEE